MISLFEYEPESSVSMRELGTIVGAGVALWVGVDCVAAWCEPLGELVHGARGVCKLISVFEGQFDHSLTSTPRPVNGHSAVGNAIWSCSTSRHSTVRPSRRRHCDDISIL